MVLCHGWIWKPIDTFRDKQADIENIFDQGNSTSEDMARRKKSFSTRRLSSFSGI